MNKIYTIIALFTISFMSSQTMFFSEYAEGSSNNKYLEIKIFSQRNHQFQRQNRLPMFLLQK